MNNTNYYENKSSGYGVGHTRLKRIVSLLRGIDKSLLNILDVGCANGRLGQEFKSLGHRVSGIDISSEAVDQARLVLDDAKVCDIEKEWPSSIGGPHDLIVLSEVVEHVFDPAALLHQVRRFLARDGRIIITTPNFMTWTNRLRFVFGKFSYTSQGMFDFGHIRWFTYSYLKQVIDEAGFVIEEEQNIIYPGKLTRILKHWPSLFAFQFIVRARLK